MPKLYLVNIKSESLEKEGKKGLLIPMEFEYEDIKGVDKKVIHDAIIRDAIKLYPQYTKKEDTPIFNISDMTKKEYRRFVQTGVYKQRSVSLEG